MLVICYGIAKSGSTLAFELVKGVLESAGYSQKKLKGAPGIKPRGRGNHLLSVEKADLAGLIDAVGPDRIVAAKTHKTFDDAMFPWLEEQQRQRRLQVIASYRDPRDICLSLVDHGAKSRDNGRRGFSRIKDLDDAEHVVSRAIGKFAKWGALEGTLRLYFETVAFDPDAAIAAIERVLGVKGDAEAAKKHAFEDAFTQRNKAKRSRYLDEMDEEWQARMLTTFGSFIEQACLAEGDQWYRAVRAKLLAGAPDNEIGVG
ncbi:MAG TPA: hypothetical protein VFV07_01575 [Rhizomicrobium sp.]|nr:hypothetical protein [Rhizomicrobium sp.]